MPFPRIGEASRLTRVVAGSIRLETEVYSNQFLLIERSVRWDVGRCHNTSGPLVCRQLPHLANGPACHVGVCIRQVQQTDVPGEIRRGGPIKRKILGTKADGTLSLQTMNQSVAESLLLGSTHRSGTKFFSLRRQPLRRRSFVVVVVGSHR
jgi:hypothetical protein